MANWVAPNDRTNETGFSAIPAGILTASTGTFGAAGLDAWWSSHSGGVHYCIAQVWNYDLKEFTTPKADGRTVRCLKD